MIEVAGMQFRRPALFSNIVLCATTLCRFGLEYEDDWNEIYSALEQSTFKEAIHYGSRMSSVVPTFPPTCQSRLEWIWAFQSIQPLFSRRGITNINMNAVIAKLSSSRQLQYNNNSLTFILNKN